MNIQLKALLRAVAVLCATITLFVSTGCTKASNAQTTSVDLNYDVKAPFRFIAYGDTRFHDPRDANAANPLVRVALVQAIAGANPAFVCMTGDIVYNGNDADDWKMWDNEIGRAHV